MFPLLNINKIVWTKAKKKTIIKIAAEYIFFILNDLIRTNNCHPMPFLLRREQTCFLIFFFFIFCRKFEFFPIISNHWSILWNSIVCVKFVEIECIKSNMWVNAMQTKTTHYEKMLQPFYMGSKSMIHQTACILRSQQWKVWQEVKQQKRSDTLKAPKLNRTKQNKNGG